jgi:3-methylcrotonyl-CoA carboxylase alpha subunit
VEWQLQVAAGRKLPKQQHELKIHGHAIEARLYAEDPRKNFLPSIGTLQRLRFGEGENIRIDTGVRQADAVTPFYDPMIAKVIAWDEDRKGAAAKLATALAHTQVAGVATNAGFLVRALRNTAFLADDIDTGFIDRHLAELTTAPPATTALPQAVEFLLIERARGDHSDPWNAQDGFRLSGEAKEHLTFTQGEDRFPVEIVHKRGATEIVIAGKPQVPASAENAMRLASGEIAVMHNGDTQVFALYDPFDSEDSSGSASDRIIAPMPGKVIQLLVKAGDKVKRGAPLAILEAMKMENTLAAQADATVAEIAVGIGDQVGEGALILTFETEAGK